MSGPWIAVAPGFNFDVTDIDRTEKPCAHACEAGNVDGAAFDRACFRHKIDVADIDFPVAVSIIDARDFDRVRGIAEIDVAGIDRANK